MILRPVHIVGPGAQRAVELPAHPASAGPARLRSDGAARSTCEDVAEAIVLALAPGRRGIYNLVGPGEVPLSAVLARARSRGPMRSRTRWRSRSCRLAFRSGCRASRSPSSISSATSAWSMGGGRWQSWDSGPGSGSARPSTPSTKRRDNGCHLTCECFAAVCRGGPIYRPHRCSRAVHTVRCRRLCSRSRATECAPIWQPRNR